MAVYVTIKEEELNMLRTQLAEAEERGRRMEEAIEGLLILTREKVSPEVRDLFIRRGEQFLPETAAEAQP